jgi:hypothetical protein
LIDQEVRILDAKLFEALALVATLHPRDSGHAIPAIGSPDLLHPVLMRDSDLLVLVVDRAGVRRTRAERIAGAASARHVHLQRGMRKAFFLQGVFILAIGVCPAAMHSGNEGRRIIDGELPASDVGAQMRTAGAT